MGKLKSHDFGKFKSFTRGQLSGSLSSFWPIILLCTPLLAKLSQDPSLGAHTHTYTSAKMDLEVKASGRRLIMAWCYPLTFDPKEPFCSCAVSPLSQKRTLDPNRVLPLCLCHDYYLKAFTRASQVVKNLPAMLETPETRAESCNPPRYPCLGKIPWTDKPAGLQSMGSHSWTELNTVYKKQRLAIYPVSVASIFEGQTGG